MKKIYCFLILAKRSKIYDQKFNFENFKKKFNTKIIYISNLVKKNEISKKKIKNLNSFFEKINPAYVTLIGNQNEKNIIFKELNKNKDIKIVDYYLDTYFTEQNFENLSKIFKLNFFNLSFRNLFFTILILSKIFWIFLKKIQNKKNVTFKINYFFYSGFNGTSKDLINKTKISYNIPSFDLLRSKNLKKILLPQKKYILFHDEMLIDHQDLKILKEKKPEDISYHKRLNNFFSYLEKKLNLDVVISLHPRSNFKKSKKLFDGRNCRIHQTPELVQKAEFTCMHASTTSISFPIIFKKKILLLTSNHIIKNFNYRFRLEMLKDYLNLSDLNIDEDQNFDFKINQFVSNKVNSKKYFLYKKYCLGPDQKKYKYLSEIFRDKLR